MLGRTVREMMETMTAAEFVDQLAYEAIDPSGEARADLRAGIIASTIANCNAGIRSRTFGPHDFIPKFGKATRQTADEMLGVKAKMKAFAAARNARAKVAANG